jgi:hypothetical protein
MGTGGMRWGAGRPAWRVKAEHCKSIDARRWAREGILPGPRSGSWAWWIEGEQTGSISYASDGHALTLSYTLSGEPVRQRVPILSTPCTYGGRRYWFGCPRCGRRVAVLYLRNIGFGCRKCCRIAYASQSEDAMDRAWRRQAKIERKLDEDWQRPKGMHQATYDRLLGRIMDCEEQRDDALAGCMARLGFKF